jgi:hypothetical protein
MRRGPLFLTTLLIALVVVPAAIADKPIREINPDQGDRLITDQCAFPVLGHIEGREIITTFADKAGNLKQIVVFPANRLTLTNLQTGKSITLVSTGPSFGRLTVDGSGFVMTMGHGPSFPNPVTGEPGIWYSSGRVLLTFDAEGNVTSVESTGKLVNLCDRLAA